MPTAVTAKKHAWLTIISFPRALHARRVTKRACSVTSYERANGKSADDRRSKNAAASPRSLPRWRDHIQRQRKHCVDEDEQGADKPGRAPAARNEARCHGRNNHHRDRAGPELKGHRS